MANRQNNVQTDKLQYQFLNEEWYCNFVKHLLEPPSHLIKFILSLHTLRHNGNQELEQVIRTIFAQGSQGFSPEAILLNMLNKQYISQEQFQSTLPYFHPDEAQKVEDCIKTGINQWKANPTIRELVGKHSWDFFHALTRNLMAGRKFSNNEFQNPEEYIKRIWRDMKDGINEAINLLQPLDFTSGDYIKRFFGKIHFYQKNLVGVWEIMFEQCPYFPIPNIPNPPNIMPVYNTWLESVNAQVVDADFVKISQLWLRQIGTWEEYELNFFKWYQEYYQWYLDTYEFRKTLEKKFAHLVDDSTSQRGFHKSI